MLFNDELNIKSDIHFFEDHQIFDKAPFFLLASPNMRDPFFFKTLIFIYECSEKGSQGIVLNKRSYSKLNDYNPLVQEPISIYRGGPVYSETPFLLHLKPDFPESDELCAGVYMCEDIEGIDFNSWTEKKEDFKVFMGISQWRPKQLQEEIQNKNWFVLDFDPSFIFSALSQKEVWTQSLGRLGEEYLILKNYTTKAYLN